MRTYIVGTNMLSSANLILVACAACCVSVAASAPLNQAADTSDAILAEIRNASAASSDFEVKIQKGKVLVRPRGTSEWKRCSEINELIAIGMLDSDQKVYLATKAITPPKPLHTKDPEYPEKWRDLGIPGQVSLHFVVDNHGMVRFPKIDVSTAPEFSAATIAAVNAWRFQPAKLNGQPVAVLVTATTTFRSAS